MTDTLTLLPQTGNSAVSPSWVSADITPHWHTLFLSLLSLRVQRVTGLSPRDGACRDQGLQHGHDQEQHRGLGRITGVVTESDPTCHRDRRVWRNQDSWHYLWRSALLFSHNIRASGLQISWQAVETLWQNSNRDMPCFDAETNGAKLHIRRVSQHCGPGDRSVTCESSVTHDREWHTSSSPVLTSPCLRAEGVTWQIAPVNRFWPQTITCLAPGPQIRGGSHWVVIGEKQYNMMCSVSYSISDTKWCLEFLQINAWTTSEAAQLMSLFPHSTPGPSVTRGEMSSIKKTGLQWTFRML